MHWFFIQIMRFPFHYVDFFLSCARLQFLALAAYDTDSSRGDTTDEPTDGSCCQKHWRFDRHAQAQHDFIPSVRSKAFRNIMFDDV